jgi:hypothetical protein
MAGVAGFVDVVMGAFLADGLHKVSDAIETFRMEVEELVRELGSEEKEQERGAT